MVARYIDQYVEQGASFSSMITISDKNGIPLNLSSYSVASAAKRSYAANTIAMIFTANVANPANGVITLALDASTSSNVPYGRYVYDVALTDPSGFVTRAVEGKVNVSPGVTGVTPPL